MVVLYILLGIVAFFVLLLSVKVRIDAEYIDDFRVRLRWLFLSFPLYPMKPREKKLKQEKPQPEKPPEEEQPPKEKKPNPFKTFIDNQGFDGVIQLIRDTADALGSLMKSIKKHLIIEELFLWVVISHNQDAARTAMEYGKACQDIYPALGAICSTLTVKKYDVEVEPDFIGVSSSAQFAFALSVRPIFLTNAAVALVVRLLFKVVFKFLRGIKTKTSEHTDPQAEAQDTQHIQNSQNIQGGAVS